MVILAGQMLSYTVNKIDILLHAAMALPICARTRSQQGSATADPSDAHSARFTWQLLPCHAAEHLLLTVLDADPWFQAELLGGAHM